MQTKIRSTMIALVAAFSFAATVAPAAQALPADTGPAQTAPGTADPGSSQAKNDGRFQSALEKGLLKAASCADMARDLNILNNAIGNDIDPVTGQLSAHGQELLALYRKRVESFKAAGCGGLS
jgi:hypothetical protein